MWAITFVHKESHSDMRLMVVSSCPKISKYTKGLQLLTLFCFNEVANQIITAPHLYFDVTDRTKKRRSISLFVHYYPYAFVRYSP
jgi:hypothetical protein